MHHRDFGLPFVPAFARHVAASGLILAAFTAWSAEPPRISPDFLVHAPADPGAYQSSPASASNGALILVVWTESSADNRLMAARVRASDGQVLDPGGLFLSAYQSFQSVPMVASDGRGFLVVWEDLNGYTGSDVMAASISGVENATPTIQVAPLIAAPGDQFFPAVASSGDGYLVVWEDMRPGSHADIYAARVGPDGVAMPAGGFALQASPYTKYRPVAASDGEAYLVAWEEARPGLDVYARRVDASGAPLDAMAFPVSAAPAEQTNLALASNGEDYLLAWEDYRMGSGADIVAARIRGSDGAVLDPAGITLASGGSYRIFPAVAASAGDYLVAWEDYLAPGGGITDMPGARVSALTGGLLEADVPLHAGPESQFLASLAAVEGRYMLSYQDMSQSGEFRIRSRFAEFDEDPDRDGVAHSLDNCPDAANADQADADGDRMGDACDPDDDNDLAPDASDNCPMLPNGDQRDADGDGLGDACDPDDDNDAVQDAADNCPLAANGDQLDTDGDRMGNVCDADDDGDGRPDTGDNCPLVANADQADRDGDGLGDACDTPSDLPLVVGIDVVPGSSANKIRIGCGVWTPVAVLGSATFNVKAIDPATVSFAGAAPKRSGGTVKVGFRDVNRDGRMDAEFQFLGHDMQLRPGDTRGELKGRLKDGTRFAGSDKVSVSR